MKQARLWVTTAATILLMSMKIAIAPRLRILFLLSLAALLAAYAQAQFTTVTGTVIDPHSLPYANGTITPTLITTASPTLSGITYTPPSQPVGLNLAGAFVMRLADNTQLQPGGTQWTFKVCSAAGSIQPAGGFGPVCFNVTLTISGASQDISAQLQAAALPLSNVASGGGGTPGGLNTQIQINNSGAFGGVPNTAPGSVLASQGLTTRPAFQQKASYDVRDWGFVCDGTTYNTSAAVMLVSAIAGVPAKVTAPGSSAPCGMGDFLWPPNIEMDFTSGWQLKTLTDSTTTPGLGTLNSGALGNCFSNGTSTSCSATVTAAAGDTYAIPCGRGFSGGAITITSNVAGDIILPIGATSPSFSSIGQAFYIPNLSSGSHTFTATSTANIVGQCSFVSISGLGPTPVIDNIGICSNVSLNSPYACSASFTAGSFLIFFGTQNNTAETCGAVGGGFTIVPGAPGCSTTTASNMGVAYQASAAGGTASPTIAFSPSPAGHGWSAMVFGLRPGTATNIIAGQIDCAQNCFVNAAGSTGGINLTGNTIPMRVRPEWWGASGATGASQTTNTAAVNAAIKAALGSGNPIYNKVLDLSGGIYQINAETQWYSIQGNTASRFEVDCASGGLAQNTANLRIMDSQGMAYGRFDNCVWEGNASSTNALLDVDWNGTTTPNSLKPQFLDFYSNTFVGNTLVDTGFLLAKSGGGAQGSNINFFDPAFQSFSGAGLQVGGDNTGRNTGRFGATNAIQIGVYGGDFQGNPNWGVACYACQALIVDGTTFEDGFSAVLGPDNQTGFDMYSQNCIGGFPPLPAIVARSVRSESRRLAAGCNLDIRDSGTINQASFPTPGSGQPVGTIIMGSVLSDGKYYRVTVDSSAASGAGSPGSLLHASSGSATTLADTNYTTSGTLTSYPTLCTAGETMTQASTAATAVITIVTGQSGPLLTAAPAGSPDSSHAWTGGTSGCVFTPTTVPAVEVNWTTNAFANFQLSTLGGTNSGCKGVISSNTSNSVTVSSWLTDYAGVPCAAPALGSTFIIEPNWGTQFSSGGLTWVDQNEDGIQGQSGSGFVGLLENVDVPGDRINIGDANLVVLRNVTVTRSDWANLTSGNVYQGGGLIANRLDVRNRLTVGSNGLNAFKNWGLARISGGRTYYSGPFGDWLGSHAEVFSCGDPEPNGNQGSCNDKWIGGVQDFTAGNNFSRNILPYCCLLGPPTPVGQDLNATQAIVGATGGLSTGLGNPGDYCINYGTTGASGTQVNPGATGVCVKGGTGNFGFGGNKGQHFITQASGSDTSGACTMTAGACAAINFTAAYNSTPACIVTWTGGGTLTGILKSNATTSQIAPSSSVNTDTAVVNYICVGNPN